MEFDLLYSNYFHVSRVKGWYDLRLGYRTYTGFPSDQLRTSAAVGWLLGTYCQLIASTELDYGFFNGRASRSRNNLAFNANYRLLKGQVECAFRLMRCLSGSIGAFRHLWGRNVGTGGGFFGGVWLDF